MSDQPAIDSAASRVRSDSGTSDPEAPTRIAPTGRRGGRWVTLGDEVYCIPPIGLPTFQAMSKDIESLQTLKGMPTSEQTVMILAIVHAAVVRNYPEMTLDELTGMVDLGNLHPLLSAALGVK